MLCGFFDEDFQFSCLLLGRAARGLGAGYKASYSGAFDSNHGKDYLGLAE